MSVKKSSTASKSTSTRRKTATASPSDVKEPNANANSTYSDEAAGSFAATKNVSARASRKVAAEKQDASGQNTGDSSAMPSQAQCEGTDAVKIIPSRRVWPD